MLDCKCKNCEKYPDEKLLPTKFCSSGSCTNKFHPTKLNPDRIFCDSHVQIQQVEEVILEQSASAPVPEQQNTSTSISNEEYGGLLIDDSRYPPKQCQDCGGWFQPSKFTWKYAKRCEECRKPKGQQIGAGVKTKQVPCSECQEIVEVGQFASNTQYCDKCRDEKGITKKGKPKHKTKKDFNRVDPQRKIKQFGDDVNNIKKKMLSIESNGHDSNKLFYVALAQLDAERLILTGIENNRRNDTVKEDIILYLIPRGFKIVKNVLYKQYYNMEYVALIFFKDKLHHITWKFEKPGREDSKLIVTRENYDKLSEHIKNDIDLIITLTGVLKDEPPLTDEYIDYIKRVSYNQYKKYDDMDI